MDAAAKKKGSLTIVGTGIKAVSHVTTEAKLAIRDAKKLYYLVADPVTAHWLKKQNSSAESLFRFYNKNKDRMVSYMEMVEWVMKAVRGGRQVCVAFYGHPGVFAFPPHEALSRAREEGYPAVMLPGISAEDCLVADLGLDPGRFGCQSFEASDFLINERKHDDTSLLILWQIGVIGEAALPTKACNKANLTILVDKLKERYSPAHKVIVYEGAVHLIGKPRVHSCRLDGIVAARITPTSTLCVPPNDPRPSNKVIFRRLFGRNGIKGPKGIQIPDQRRLVSRQRSPYSRDAPRK